MQEFILRKEKIIAGMFVLCWFVTGNTYGQNDIKFTLGSRVIDKVTEVRQYYYSVRKYEPSLKVDFKKYASIKNVDSPEKAALLQVSSMLVGNYQQWFDLWDAPSQALMNQRNKEKNRDSDFWVQKWKEGLSKYNNFMLNKRIDTGEFVIIEFVASNDNDKSVQDLPLDIPMKKEADGQWRVTQHLANDPVANYWRQPGHTYEVMAREYPVKVEDL